MLGFPGMTRNKRFRLMMFALVFAIVAGLFAVAETAVRIRQWLRYGMAVGIEDTYTFDPVSGLRVPIPGGTFGPIHINSRGFRGADIDVPKPDNVLRVAFLGSSTTYCAEVSSDEAAWPHIVAAALRKNWPAVSLDYVNGGVPGFTASTTLRNLRARVTPLAPDVIVIYEGHNDISRNSFDLAVKKGLIAKRLGDELMWPAKYSLLWYLVEKNLQILGQQRIAASTSRKKLTYEKEALVAPFRRDFRELIEESKKVAKLVVVVTLSNRLRSEQSVEDRIGSSVTHLYYMPYMTVDGLLNAYRDYNDIIRAVAQESGALLVSGEDEIPGNGENFVDSIHFTDRGSRAMAERTVRQLIASDEFRNLATTRSAYKATEPGGHSAGVITAAPRSSGRQSAPAAGAALRP
jgi:lysophospholipase L1-like esterase